MAVAVVARVAAAAVEVVEEMANAKQTVRRRQKINNQLSKIKKIGSEDDGKSGVAAVSGERQCGDGCGVGQCNGGERRRRPQQQPPLSAAVVVRRY